MMFAQLLDHLMKGMDSREYATAKFDGRIAATDNNLSVSLALPLRQVRHRDGTLCSDLRQPSL
jgi:hypothetical protein